MKPEKKIPDLAPASNIPAEFAAKPNLPRKQVAFCLSKRLLELDNLLPPAGSRGKGGS